jgi:hypothetical protein
MASLGSIVEGLFVCKERFVLGRAFWEALHGPAQLLFLHVVGSDGHVYYLAVTGEGNREAARELKVEEENPGGDMEPETRYRYRSGVVEQII